MLSSSSPKISPQAATDKKEPLHMLVLEETLAKDPDGTALQHIKDTLTTSLTEAKASIAKGLPPESFQNQEAIVKALENGIAVAEKYWNFHHKISSSNL